MQNHNELISKLNTHPEQIEFAEVIAFIDANYQYAPCAFTNGKTRNEAGANEGSCKIFAFARLQKLSQTQTLALFGHYYRNDVLGNPKASDHANIRNFMEFGWQGIHFEGEALS